MKIGQINSSQSFKSRNSTIRFADDISRKVNTIFPHYSTSRFSDFQNYNNFKNNLGEFYKLGFGDALPLSAEHNQGIISLIDKLKTEIKKIENSLLFFSYLGSNNRQ